MQSADHKATDEYAWFSRAISLRGVFLSSGASEEVLYDLIRNSYYDSSMHWADHKPLMSMLGLAELLVFVELS